MSREIGVNRYYFSTDKNQWKNTQISKFSWKSGYQEKLESKTPTPFLRFALSKGGVFDMLLDGVKKITNDQLLHYNWHAWRVFWEPRNLMSQNSSLSKGGVFDIGGLLQFLLIAWASALAFRIHFPQHYFVKTSPAGWKDHIAPKSMNFGSAKGDDPYRHFWPRMAY